MRIIPPFAAQSCTPLGFRQHRTTFGRRRRCGIAFVLVASLMVLVMLPFIEHGARAAEVTLTWDRTPDVEVAGYKVYWGTESGAYSTGMDIGSETDATVTQLEEGQTYFFAVTAYTTDGLESDFSNEVTFTPGQQCTYVISPMSDRFNADGGESTVTVATEEGCPWVVSSNASWITVLSGGTGTGNGTIRYALAANDGPLTRSAGITVAGRIFTAYQGIGSTSDRPRRELASSGKTQPRGRIRNSR